MPSRMSVRVREALETSLARDVAYLVKRDRVADLRIVLSMTGYKGSKSDTGVETAKQLGKMIGARAPELDKEWLEDATHTAAFHRHHSIDKRRRKPGDWDRASALADQRLRDAGVDVEHRNAKRVTAEIADSLLDEPALRRLVLEIIRFAVAERNGHAIGRAA